MFFELKERCPKHLVSWYTHETHKDVSSLEEHLVLCKREAGRGGSLGVTQSQILVVELCIQVPGPAGPGSAASRISKRRNLGEEGTPQSLPEPAVGKQ